MLPAALVAFAHFLAFFALTAAIVLELALLGDSPSVESARRIRRADRAAGLSALAVVIFGFLRVFYFEKGSGYYFDNTFFQLKLVLFFSAALMSIYPTLQFASWRPALQENRAPEVPAQTLTRIRRVLHWELVLIVGVLLCASLLAKGYGI
jgi:putative membrane protein